LINMDKNNKSRFESSVTSSQKDKLGNMNLEERLKRHEDDLRGELDTKISALCAKRESVIALTLRKIKLTKNVDFCFILTVPVL
ncbi:5458_t:CDS:1, partial [Dentiscutata heterogama]